MITATTICLQMLLKWIDLLQGNFKGYALQDNFSNTRVLARKSETEISSGFFPILMCSKHKFLMCPSKVKNQLLSKNREGDWSSISTFYVNSYFYCSHFSSVILTCIPKQSFEKNKTSSTQKPQKVYHTESQRPLSKHITFLKLLHKLPTQRQ